MDSKYLYGKPLILAHRCVYPGYPENTILSLQKVIDEGAEYVEVDCEFTKDFHVVVSHDSEIKRCTNGKGEIKNLTYDEIRRYNAAHYIGNSEYGFNPIPNIEEIFQKLQPTNLMAELHIKNLEVLDVEEYPDVNVLDLMLKYKIEPRCNINIDVLAPAEFIYEYPKYEKCRFTLNAYIPSEISEEKQIEKLKIILQSLQKYEFFGIDLHPEIITSEMVRIIHEYPFELQSYPTNSPEMMRKLINVGCDVIQTDHLDILKTVRYEMGFV